jgi:tyrosyl-tRNA synthetase
MPGNVYQSLSERGYVYQSTDKTALENILDSKNIAFYAGFDPTADSLHVGHLLPVMAMRQLQMAGHKPIALVGGATALVGDPSGKQEARPILSKEKVAENTAAIKKQLSRFINFDDGNAILVDNADWLEEINLLDFLREVGSRFGVNRMIAAESVKSRLETGISYLEFSYMLLQAYDFHILNKRFECLLEVGGQDQWGNIVAGVELIRKLSQKEAHGLTFPLLTDKAGAKFGKTAGGAVWLDTKRTSVFDYYQFWRNTDDADVGKLLKLFTNLPLDEIKRLESLQAPAINRAKEILAFEATRLAHGAETAEKAFLAATAEFGSADPEGKIKTSSKIVQITEEASAEKELPKHVVSQGETKNGIWIVKLLADAGLASSNGEARRLLKGGGVYLNDERITDMDKNLAINDFNNGSAILRAGKKNIRKIVIQ